MTVKNVVKLFMEAEQREALQITWKSTKKNPPQITNVISVIKITNQKQYCSDTREWTVQNIWHQVILPELFKFCIFCTVCKWNHYCDWNMKLSLWLKYEITIVIKLLVIIFVKHINKMN